MTAGRGARRVLNIGTGLVAGTLAVAMGTQRAVAQMPIGSVATVDAVVSGSTATDNQRSVLLGNVTVTAKDHPAYVELFRGGSVKVCSTSGVHLTAGTPIVSVAPKQEIGPADANPDVPAPSGPPQFPLMVSLDRGAAELHTSMLSSDVMMTPDLRVSFSESGPLDLRVRVASNGDTCVENRVAGLASTRRSRSAASLETTTTGSCRGSMCSSSTEICARWWTTRARRAAVRTRR